RRAVRRRSADAPRRRRRRRVRGPAFRRVERRSRFRRELDRRRSGGLVAFFEEKRVALVPENQRALGAEERLVIIVERVGLNRRERGGAAAGVFERRVDVIVNLAP